jgi:pimeloyl-ACP methyl ester carboxylesterase
MELFYKVIGQGPSLIILHGLYGSGDNWVNIARALSDHFTVYLIDQRNHGRSPHSVSHTYIEMSDDINHVIEKIGIDTFCMIGHSMGGKTAITYTLKQGSKVKKLINVDISPFSYHDIDNFQDQYEYHKSIVERFVTAPIESAKSRTEIENYFAEKITNISTRRFLLKNLKRNQNGEFSWKLNINTLAKSLHNVIDAAPPVKMGAQSYVETLFIRGGKSPYISDEDMESTLDVFPNSKFITYEDSGHWLHSEEAVRFIKDVKNFLL